MGNEVVYEIVTKRIIESLENGVVPWQKPWDARTDIPRNLVSKQAYRGVNLFLLLSLSYQSPYWLTFRQVAQKGGSVRKGEKACRVIFWRNQNDENGENPSDGPKVPVLRYYHVFNLMQCDKVEVPPELTPVETKPLSPVEAAEMIVAGMPNPPAIERGRIRACYDPRHDEIWIPSQQQFANPSDYYACLFHELIHATGHETRLNRKSVMENKQFGNEEYSKEELIAEIGSSFLCAYAGIMDRTFNNATSYIGTWLQKLKSDSRLIVQAAAAAQRAADFIVGIPVKAANAAESSQKKIESEQQQPKAA